MASTTGWPLQPTSTWEHFPGYDEWYVLESPRDLIRLYDGNYFEFCPAVARYWSLSTVQRSCSMPPSRTCQEYWIPFGISSK